MANVTDKVAIIRNATYGNEVREGIASGIEAINTEVGTYKTDEVTRSSEFDTIKTDYDTYKNVMIAESNVATLQNNININSTQLAQIPQQTNIMRSAKVTRFIAHRGLSYIAPENTLKSMEMAGRVGMWGVETDVLATLDGVLILMHDSTVDRTTDGTGTVSNMLYSEIQALTIDVGNNIAMYPNLKVPTFEDYLITCKRFNLVPVIENKWITMPSDLDTFVNLIKKQGLEESCFVISADYTILQAIRERSKKIMLQYLADDMTQATLNKILLLKNTCINPTISLLTKTNIELAHANGIMVNCWVTDTYQQAKTYISYGVDYITTNRIVGVV